MSTRAQILQRMYGQGRVTLSGLKKAVTDFTITATEFEEITGEAYEREDAP